MTNKKEQARFTLELKNLGYDCSGFFTNQIHQLELCGENASNEWVTLHYINELRNECSISACEELAFEANVLFDLWGGEFRTWEETLAAYVDDLHYEFSINNLTNGYILSN